MSETAFGQTAADGIVVHDDFLAHVTAYSLVCQSAHFQNCARYLKTENHSRPRESAVLTAPQKYVASGQPAVVHVHANLSTSLS